MLLQAAAVAQWARLARSQRYRAAVKQLRDGLQADLLEAQAQCAAQARGWARGLALAPGGSCTPISSSPLGCVRI